VICFEDLMPLLHHHLELSCGKRAKKGGLTMLPMPKIRHSQALQGANKRNSI
jgi:hypothetical protein